MEKIILSEKEIEVIKLQLDGKIGIFTATDEQKEILMRVTAAAEALMEKLDAYDELGDDLIAWYYNKYKSQAA